MCASSNSMLNLTHPQFGVGHGSLNSHTIETAWIAGKWLGVYDDHSSCVTIVDTPGVSDTSGRDCSHGALIAEAVKNLSPIDAFVLIIKGTETRFTQAIQDQLSFYEELFGQDFWKKTIIEISFWRSSAEAREERLEDRFIDEKKLTHDLNTQLKQKFGLTQTIPVVFVDPMYRESRGRRNPEEKAAFESETEKMWNFVQSGHPYRCEENCNSPGFLMGRPSLRSEPIEQARLEDKVVMEFSIWFSGCDGSERSYEVLMDGVLIWTVIDKQGEKGKEKEPKVMIDNENTPPHMEIIDQCSQMTGTGTNQKCNIELSKFKNVKVVFSQVTEDSFGSYYVNTAKGPSRVVRIEERVDGFYSDWTEWSPWNEVNQS